MIIMNIKRLMIIFVLVGIALIGSSVNVMASTELITKNLSSAQIGPNMIVDDVSNNGRYIVFISNSDGKLYLFDKEQGTVTLVDDHGWSGQVSDDGRYVAYTKFINSYIDEWSEEEIIVTQVGVWDSTTGQTTLIPSSHDLYDFSGDNRYVLYDDGYLYDRVTGAASGPFGDQMSDDARYFANLGTAYSGYYTYLFHEDRVTGNRIPILDWLIGGVSSVSISDNGEKIIIVSGSSGIVSNDTNGKSDVFIWDKQTGTKNRITMGYDGQQANGDSTAAIVSGDGNYVVFTSKASNLVSNDTNGKQDVFLYNLQTGQTERINIKYDGTQADQDCNPDIFINFDGSLISYTTKAQLSQDDTDYDNDLYYWYREFNTSINLTGTKGKNDWYISDVNVSFQTSRPSDVMETVYSYDQTTWYKYTGQFTINKEAKNDIYFYSKGKNGYIEPVKQCTIKIDKSAPEISFSMNDGSLLELKNGESFPFKIKVTDGISGIPAGNEVIWGNEVTSPNGENMLRIRAENEAGIEAVKDLRFIWSTP